MAIRRIAALLIPTLVLLSCSMEQKHGNIPAGETGTPKGELVFNKTEHDLGTVLQGETVGCSFQFTNTGEESVILLEASASCGCTVPRYSKEPIPPGGKGTVELMFDSTGRIGNQRKTVTIRNNGTQPVVQLTIIAEIIKS